MSLAHLIGSIRTWTLWTSTLMSSVSHCDERQESDEHQTVVFLLFSWGTCGYTEWMYELCHSYPLDSLFFVIHIFFIFSKRNAHRNKTNKTKQMHTQKTLHNCTALSVHSTAPWHSITCTESSPRKIPHISLNLPLVVWSGADSSTPWCQIWTTNPLHHGRAIFAIFGPLFHHN